MQIGSREIGQGNAPFVIAEMSGNHNQSLERALEIVEAAAGAGAHALKLQTYTADTMTLDLEESAFRVEAADSPWAGSSLYQLYQRAFTPWEWHERILARATELGMVAFSTPFDASAVDFLEQLGVVAYKIASFENTDLPLIRMVASTGKPLLLSTGMASMTELEEAVQTARAAGCKDMVLLKCTSAYPASPGDANLTTIPHMRGLFGCEVGLSDHTLGLGVSLAAVALGATVIERHLTIRRSDGGVDSAFSLEPEELRMLVTESERAWQALGRVNYGATGSEVASRSFRRSLYLVEDVEPGGVLTRSNVRAIRPGFGLPPKYLEQVLGRRLPVGARRGTPLGWSLLE
jgi:pseudaminic acid synthase